MRRAIAVARRRCARAAAWTALALAAACARNPATGERQLSLVSKDQEIALGKQAAEQVRQTMGEYDDRELQAYVERVGMRIAKGSERPELPWSFTVIDDPAVNAFALPGGPVFVTRGLLTYLTSEAELAAVLGHEIGHITARHSVEQLSKAQLAQVGLGVGMVVSQDLRRFGQVAGAGMQLLFLEFGRDDERQADALGFRYMVEQRYDPRQMAAVFRTLETVSARAGGGRVPGWLSTHPDPGDRAETAARRAAKVEAPDRMEVDREQYLAKVDDVVFGEDPRQGYLKGGTFVHPQLGFQLTLPQGWKAQNTAAALVAVSPRQDAALQLTAAGKASPEEAVQRFFSQQGVRPVQAAPPPVPHGGAARWFEAATEQGNVGGVVAFVPAGGTTLQIVEYAPAERLQGAADTFRRVLASFGPVTDPAARAVQPARLDVVKVPRDMSLADFAREFPSTAPPEVLAALNGVAPGGTLRAGQAAKRVVGGSPALVSGR